MVSRAADRIRSDLAQLRKARHCAFGLYVGLLCLFLVAMEAFAHPVRGSVSWMVALILFLIGASASAGLALGIPLLHGRALTVSLGSSLGVMVFGLIVAVKAGTPVMWQGGASCFIYGTGVSALAMVVLGAVSGRLWRRFPDPGFLLALATTGVGLMALHMRCPSQNAVHLFAFHLSPLFVVYGLARLLTATRAQFLQNQ
ncbi:MAG: hypothetical protein ACFB9M_16900 [Myxococcota bacterium]